MTLSTKPVLSRWSIFVAIAKDMYGYGYKLLVKIIDFSFMPKIIRILIKDHVEDKKQDIL